MTPFEFVKSSFSGGNAGQECVEVALNVPGVVAVRDSKVVAGPVICFGPALWDAFRSHVADGDVLPGRPAEGASVIPRRGSSPPA
ncbi:DUF397 domain-containing protein [Streptomyces sp. SID10853]|nr:DUF397 domain-containing protein [Streptomyces sp. SID10853]